MWFETLFGFPEENPQQVRNNIEIQGEFLTSRANGKTYQHGHLEIPTFAELRTHAPSPTDYHSRISISEVVGDVQELHQDVNNTGALFQAASQFNLLEMIDPHVTPEQGISGYEHDRTQGPACAIACGAGTLYRQYFVEIDGQLGQTKAHQIDCLEEIGKVFRNNKSQLWTMQNGYALATWEGLKTINAQMDTWDATTYEAVKDKLKIGIQWDTEVTLSPHKHTVTQAYCSALPVAYSQIDSQHWEKFARLVLEASYEATFYAALKNYEAKGNNCVFLTLVGGGVFGNEMRWILEAIERSIRKFWESPLDIKIVSYGRSKREVREFVDRMNLG